MCLVYCSWGTLPARYSDFCHHCMRETAQTRQSMKPFSKDHPLLPGIFIVTLTKDMCLTWPTGSSWVTLNHLKYTVYNSVCNQNETYSELWISWASDGPRGRELDTIRSDPTHGHPFVEISLASFLPWHRLANCAHHVCQPMNPPSGCLRIFWGINGIFYSHNWNPVSLFLDKANIKTSLSPHNFSCTSTYTWVPRGM